MTTHPNDRDWDRLDALADEDPIALRDAAWRLATALAAAEHRATRAEAQSDIRGRAVVIYRDRAREAEAERDEWRQTALDERGAALDALEQVKAREAQSAARGRAAAVYHERARQAEARINDARDILDHSTIEVDGWVSLLVSADDIRAALDGEG